MEIEKLMEEEKTRFVSAYEVAEKLEISKPTAYKLIREENKKLRDEGYFVIAGKLPREYFESKLFGGSK